MTKRLQIFTISVLMAMLTACGSGDTKGEESAPAIKGGKTVLTLSIQEPTPFYKFIEKKFEEKYPNIDLQIDSYKQAGEEWGAGDFEKYKKTTTTALLSGKGADVIEVGSLPTANYISKQLLLNMDDLFKQDTWDKTNLEMNVIEALKVDDGIYSIPSGFFLRILIGDGDALSTVALDEQNWNWQKFEELSANIMNKESEEGKAQRYALAGLPPEVLLQEMVVDQYPKFVDASAKQAKFDSPAFLELMKKVKQMYQSVASSEPAEMGQQLFYSAALLSPADFINVPYTYFSNPQLLQVPHDGAPGIHIIPDSQFAIRANSPVKEEAKQFMAFLLSEEVQASTERPGFSLLKSVNEKQLDLIKEQVNNETFKLPDGKVASVPEEQFVRYKKLLEQANQFAQLDGKILQIIGEESATYYNDQKTVEEVSRLIQNRSNTFLNE